MIIGASLRFFEVELEVEGVSLEVEGTGLEDEWTGLKDEGTGLEDERTGFLLEGIGFLLEGVSFKLEDVFFKREGTAFELEEVSFEVCGADLELEEAGSTIRFFEEVDSTAVSAARRRFFCFFSLVSYNAITASVSYQYMNERGDLQGQQPRDLQWTASSASWS